MSDERMGPGTYMTPDEAKEFHNLFVVSMGFFVIVACVAHFMVWLWRPWFPGTESYKQGMAMSAPATAPVVAAKV